jgi:hypothetical protein
MEVTEEILGYENRRNKQANINYDICSLFSWYLFYGKIVQIKLFVLVLIHTPVKVYITSLVQKSQILHYIFYIN